MRKRVLKCAGGPTCRGGERPLCLCELQPERLGLAHAQLEVRLEGGHLAEVGVLCVCALQFGGRMRGVQFFVNDGRQPKPSTVVEGSMPADPRERRLQTLNPKT